MACYVVSVVQGLCLFQTEVQSTVGTQNHNKSEKLRYKDLQSCWGRGLGVESLYIILQTKVPKVTS